MAQHIRDEFFQIPIVTRVFTSACVLTTLAVVSYLFPVMLYLLALPYIATQYRITVTTDIPSSVGHKGRGEWMVCTCTYEYVSIRPY